MDIITEFSLSWDEHKEELWNEWCLQMISFSSSESSISWMSRYVPEGIWFPGKQMLSGALSQ